MTTKQKLLLSLLAALLAMRLYQAPMWWGVLFPPITRELTTASLSQDTDGWFRWESEGLVLRFKTLDLLFSFFR